MRLSGDDCEHHACTVGFIKQSFNDLRFHILFKLVNFMENMEIHCHMLPNWIFLIDEITCKYKSKQNEMKRD